MPVFRSAIDGGRRWRKDLAGNAWTWYPCGVQCCAGQLVEKQSDLSGSTWTTSAQYLQGIGIVSRNGEFHHFGVQGAVSVITDNAGATLQQNVYDAFTVQRYHQGNAQTPWIGPAMQSVDEGTYMAGGAGYLPQRAFPMQQPVHPDPKPAGAPVPVPRPGPVPAPHPAPAPPSCAAP